jgi:hypothetical protein
MKKKFFSAALAAASPQHQLPERQKMKLQFRMVK